MTEKHSDHTSDETTADITSAFRANFFEPAVPTTARAQCAVSGIDELPSGSALLVVKRGPNAGSRFVLDQPMTSAGRHPNSDIFWWHAPSLFAPGLRTAMARNVSHR